MELVAACGLAGSAAAAAAACARCYSGRGPRLRITAARFAALTGVIAICSPTTSAAPLLTTTGQPLEFYSFEHIFAFGDSYTASGYSPRNGINNITLFGNTSSNGLNWLQLLALSNPSINASRQFFDLADFGATTNNSIVPSAATDFVDQVAEFQQYFVPAPAQAPWQSNNTLFTIWIGINDVGFGFLDNISYAVSQPLIEQTWINMINLLYSAGARNFLVLGVPSTEKTPLVQSYGPADVAIFQNNVDQYNAMLASFVPEIPQRYPDTKAMLFDTQPFFNAILETPLRYGFTDATTVCPSYVDVNNNPYVDLPTCPWPFVQYVWKNTYHPTWPVHLLLAEVLLNALDASLAGASVDSGQNATVSGTATPTVDPTYIPTMAPSVTSARSVAMPIITSITSAGGVVGGRPTGTASSSSAAALPSPPQAVFAALGLTFLAALSIR